MFANQIPEHEVRASAAIYEIARALDREPTPENLRRLCIKYRTDNDAADGTILKWAFQTLAQLERSSATSERQGMAAFMTDDLSRDGAFPPKFDRFIGES